MLLNLEEDSVGETPDTGTPPSAIDDGKLQWMFRDCLDRSINSPWEALSKLRAYVVIPGTRFSQFGVSLRQPDDRQRHGFLNRLALTCSQGMTSEGFCSCRAMR